jgi:transposase
LVPRRRRSRDPRAGPPRPHLDAWRPELPAYFDTGGVSIGPTEAINGLIKKVKRLGHGYCKFNN